MALEDFERSLAESREVEDGDGAEREDRERRKRRKHHHHHRSHPRDGEDEYRHKRSRHSRNGDDEDGAHKRSRNSGGVEERCKEQRKHRHNERRSGENGGKSPVREEEWIEKDGPAAAFTEETKDIGTAETQTKLKRDSWMEAPSALDIDYTQRGAKKVPESTTFRSSKADFELKIHENEINKHHLQNLAEGKDIPDEVLHESAQHEVDYTFGDAGAQWRMTKLKAVYREADESGQSLDDIAIERFGDLRSFDDAREEQIELERRDTYGEGYVGKEKPSGELFQERKLDMGVRRDAVEPEVLNYEDKPLPQGQVMDTLEPSARTVPLDQSALNRLKAQMIKAKLRGAANAVSLEDEYNSALAGSANRIESGVIVLGTMENRMLAGGRKGEVRSIDNKRGRERGLVEENEDMSIEDMVREERRTRGQAGGEGQRFAERIAKDGKFDNDLDYMDENANKLAKRVQKSEINLKNTAISDFQKMNRILDNCPLCHHEDTDTPPVAPVVSLATRVYLTLPTEPEISDGGACIVPIQHRGNLLECDEDEWEEIRNFMKSLLRMYHDQGRDVIFYENAAVPQRKKHAGMEVVPLPYSLGETAPAFFKEAILTADEEWTQHKKLIDTLSKAKQGLGKMAFRRTLVKEMPYFHVWFELDGGLGHIVEDANRWPKGDLFAREIIGGMLDAEPDVIKRQGRWNKGGDRRLDSFRKRWGKFDWTKVLTDN